MSATAVDALTGVPAELRERPQWVTWRREERAGKQTKIPYRADGNGRASSTDPTTWASFEAAVAGASALSADGVGFVFSADDPFVGVDLDGVLDADGRLADSGAAAIVGRLDSYTELSVSRTGLHVIVRGALNGGRHRGPLPSGRGAFEAYDRGRYFAFTGDHLRDCPSTVEARQEQLDATLAWLFPAPVAAAAPSCRAPVGVDDEDLLSRAFAARNGGEVRALYEGAWTGRYPSQSEADLALVGALAFWTGPSPERLDGLFRRSGLMRDKWDDRRGESSYGADTIATALAGRTQFWSALKADRPHLVAERREVDCDGTAERNDESVSSSEPATTGEESPSPVPDQTTPADRGLDDVGNAWRLVDRHGTRLRYVPAWDRWLVYDGRRLAEDDLLKPMSCAKDTARAIAAEAAAEPDEAQRRKLLAHAVKSATEPRLRAMLTVAGADSRIAVRPAELDADPFALNTPSGVVDLRTGGLSAHRPEQLLTKLAGAPFDPNAVSPLWDAHLRRVLVEPELIAFMQRLVGVAAIGEVREHVLAILWGAGANGKSVFRNAIAFALGDYAYQASIDLLLQASRGPGQATPELAELKGRRFVTVGETPEDGRLATERVKWITGGEPINARRLYSNPYTFEPSHTTFLLTNHKPRIGDDGDGIWRRVLLIPFAVTIPEAEQDRELGAKLRAERAGILRWIVEGAVTYLRDGLNPPDAVRAATADYRGDEDTFGDFLAERTVLDDTASTQGAALMRAYESWADKTGGPSITRNALADKLQARGFGKVRRNTGARWIGIRLSDDDALDGVTT